MNPVIESLRVLGALMVVVHHYTYQLSAQLASQWTGLHFFHNGVDLFFVITGYLFAPFLLGNKPISATGFIKRRFFRLYPLYLLSLITLALATQADLSLVLLIEHLFLVQNLPFHSLAETGAISLVYWTLATEFQFYAFVLVVAIFYRDVQADWKLTLLLLASMIGFLSSAYLNYSPKSDAWVLWQAQLPALLLEFSFGVIVYQYASWWSKKVLSRLLLFASLLLLWWLYSYYPLMLTESLTARPFGWFNVLSALGYAGLMAGLLGLQVRTKREFPTISKVAVFCGGLSYAVYLFHEAAIRWLNPLDIGNEIRVFLALLLTLTIAVVANHCLEIPLREYGRR